MQLVRDAGLGLENEEGLLFFPEECETIAVNVVQVACGQRTEPASHPDEEEVYTILDGTGIVYLDGVSYPVTKGSVVYIPRNKEHIVEGTGKEPLMYVCVANWPDIVPSK